MKITALEVDGYGIWTGLNLGGLSDGLNVLYGPNEAGKTTLMQFVRSVLYGFGPQRQCYLPPVRGGRPGGSVDVVGPNGRFQVSRHQNEDDNGSSEVVTLSAADGTRQGDHLLNVLLCNIDEPVFNNVFAVGLEELQELGTLGDTEAASLLYSLTAGLDRVALVDVVRELETSRNRLLGADGGACQVTQLLAQRETLRSEIEDLDGLTRRYLRLAAQRDQVNRDTVRLEEEGAELRHQVRVIEIAIAVGDRWQRRRDLDDQLLAFGPVQSIPDGAVDRLDAINARLAKRGQYVDQLRAQWERLRSEAADLKVNEALWRLAPRIEALSEQESWIDTLQRRSAELESEITDLEVQLAAEQERLGLGKEAGAGVLPTVSAGSLRALRQPARALRRSRLSVEEAKQEVASAREAAQSLADQIGAALAARGRPALAEAMDQTGSLVSQLRRRVQIDQRLDEMDRYQVELEEQSRRLLERQVLPVWLLAGLGVVFVLSVVLILAGLLMPASVTGSLGWPLALLGLAGLGATVGTKFTLERSTAQRLEACQKQIAMLQLQVKQAKQERETLDEQLSPGDGSVAGRLTAAEQELAELEELVPLDARRKAAEQEAQAADGRVRQAEGEFSAARRRWQEALQSAGLPRALAPKQVRELASRSDHVGDLQRRLEHRYEEYEQRRRELETLTERVTQLAREADLIERSEEPIEQVRALTEELRDQEARLKRREVLRGEARQLRRKRAKTQAAILRLKHHRRELFSQVGVDDEPEFRQLATQVARAEALRGERDALSREIDAAIAGHCPEEAVREQLEGDHGQGLDQRHAELEARLQATEAKLEEQFEKRGQLTEQLKALAEDRRPGAKQLELAMVERQLEEAIDRWRVLAVTSRILQTIRTTYEQERQPETLQEASGYLERMTLGRYVRVWTPLDRDVLLVDDAEGRSLQIERLSRGAREQLFLCIRLALAGSFARRGAQLPIVLDDVLVNFDGPRAKAAVALLRDFAKVGQQVFVFTCHEHIVKMFSSLRVQVSRLPENGEPSVPMEASRKGTKRQRKRKSEPQHEVVAESRRQRPRKDVLEAPDDEPAAEVLEEEPSEAQAEPDDEIAIWEEVEMDESAEPLAAEDDADELAEDEDYDHEDDVDDEIAEESPTDEDEAETDEDEFDEVDEELEDEEEYDEDDEYDEEEDDDYDEDDLDEAEAA